jgi:mannonate dehydratase
MMIVSLGAPQLPACPAAGDSTSQRQTTARVRHAIARAVRRYYDGAGLGGGQDEHLFSKERPMHRRRFLQGALVGTALGAGPAPAAVPRPVKKALMKAGHQNRSSDADLRVLAALGVNNICSELPSRTFDDNWSVKGLTALRERVERFGIKLDMVPLPLSSSPISRAENPNIMLGKDPERGREIEQICNMIRNEAEAGISAVKYNLTILGVVRTASKSGRGGARYNSFVYEDAKDRDGDPPKESGAVSEKLMWERITWFLERVVPVAEKAGVRLCCHPHDPGMPPGKGYRGIHRVLGSVDGLKKFVEIAPSKYHGLNFCQGTVAEMLQEPGREIYEVIRYFGSKGKIFNVHFRNIRGSFLNFQETFPDDGDVDMIRCMRVYREVGYDGMIMPDHAPQIEGDTRAAQAFAFAFGYIQAMIQMVKSEA